MKLNFPKFSLSCHKQIEDNGFSAWFVGGCVRDALIDRPFTDIDIATNAMPEDIIKIFDKTIPTGIKHGTVTVLIDGNSIEVTTFRCEEGYLDNRHPDTVHFKSDIKEDLSRRDFTINALAYHPRGELLDLFGGLDDLKNGIIKCVNQPSLRFTEDALRILRAYRFSSQLGFSIEEKTEKAAVSLIDNLKKLSGERIFSELKKLVCGNKIETIIPLISMGGLNFCGIKNDTTHLSLITNLPNVEEVRFASFLNICGFDCNLIKDVLKIDNKTLKFTTDLFEILKSEIPKNKTEVKKLLSKYDIAILEFYTEYLTKILSKDNNIKELLSEIRSKNEPYLISHLAISGNDIKLLGFKGEQIGEKMQFLLNLVINEPGLNNKEILISNIKN